MEERVLLQSNSLYRVTTKNELDSFCCGDEDLDDFAIVKYALCFIYLFDILT